MEEYAERRLIQAYIALEGAVRSLAVVRSAAEGSIWMYDAQGFIEEASYLVASLLNKEMERRGVKYGLIKKEDEIEDL